MWVIIISFAIRLDKLPEGCVVSKFSKRGCKKTDLIVKKYISIIFIRIKWKKYYELIK